MTSIPISLELRVSKAGNNINWTATGSLLKGVHPKRASSIPLLGHLEGKDEVSETVQRGGLGFRFDFPRLLPQESWGLSAVSSGLCLIRQLIIAGLDDHRLPGKAFSRLIHLVSRLWGRGLARRSSSNFPRRIQA